MKRSLIRTFGSQVAALLLTTTLTACGSSGSSADNSGIATFVSPCTPDANGFCYAQEKRVPDDNEWKTLKAELNANAENSPVSSQNSSADDEESPAADEWMFPGFEPEEETHPSATSPGSATLTVIGGSTARRSSSSRSSAQYSARSFSSRSYSSRSARSSGASALIRVDGRTVFARSSSSRSFSSRALRERTSDSDFGVGRADPPSNGYRYRNSRCARSRSFLSLFPEEELTTGSEGWTFPVLLNGDCPISVGILKVNTSGTFGGSLDLGD